MYSLCVFETMPPTPPPADSGAGYLQSPAGLGLRPNHPLGSGPLTRGCAAQCGRRGSQHPPPSCCPARRLGKESCVSVETQLKCVFPFRVLVWRNTFVHGCALFLPHGRACAIHTTRPTRSRLRFVYLPVCDTHTLRAGMCPRVCSRGPRQPRVQACGPRQLCGSRRRVSADVPTDAPASSAREGRDSPLVTMSSY